MKKKPANPLLKFVPNDNNKQSENKKPSLSPVAPKTQSFDEMPIRSAHIEQTVGDNFSLNSIKENQSINIDNPSFAKTAEIVPNKSHNFDEMPIRGVKEYQIDNSYCREEGRSSKQYVDMEERPLTGSHKNFKELIKEHCPIGGQL